MALRVLSSSISETVTMSTGTENTAAFVVFQVSGTWVGSIQPLKRVAGANTFVSCSYTRTIDGAIASSSISSVGGIYTIDTAGCEVAFSHNPSSGMVWVFANTIAG